MALAALFACWLSGPVVSQETPTFEVGGEKFAISRYPQKAGATKRPVIIVVHGIDGMGGQSGTQIRKFAKQIADKGFLAVVPHYFGKDDGSDTDLLPKLVELRAPKFNSYVPRIAAAVKSAAMQSDADGGRLGLVGFSLGGGVALKHAQSAPSGKIRIKAVVDFFGFIPDDAIYKNADKLPPTLVLHNKTDQIVKLRLSEDLVIALKAKSVKHDYRFYDDENPGFFNHPFRPGGKADVDSRERALNWLEAFLKS
jgi:dienelactone hydrolase